MARPTANKEVRRTVRKRTGTTAGKSATKRRKPAAAAPAAAAPVEAAPVEVEILPPEPVRASESTALLHAPMIDASQPRGWLGLARGVLGQVLRSETVGQAVATAAGLARAVQAGLGAAGATEVDEYGKDASLEQSLTPITNFLYERYWRVSVHGAELLPSGPAVLVANHSGAIPLDGAILHEAVRRERPELAEPRWLVEDQVFYAPFIGTLFNRLGAIRACPENALRLLDSGHPVMVFPEGVYGLSKPFGERYQLKRLGRGGFAKLALRAGVPIVPVAIVGAEESLPLLAKLPGRFLGLPYLPLTTMPLPAKWTVRFGAPLKPQRAAAEDPAEVDRLVEQTRASIEGMLQALLSARGSVFSG